jgi:hypothetical protein
LSNLGRVTSPSEPGVEVDNGVNVKRFSVKTGFIFKDETAFSNQIDIIIIDEYEASAYIYQEGDFAIVRPRSVIAVMEIKTLLRPKEFDESLNNIASAKRLADNPEQICGMVFGYEGTNPTPSVLNRWFKRPSAKALAKTPRLGPTLFSFFLHGTLLIRLNYENKMRIDDSSNYHITKHVSKIAEIDEPTNEGWQLRHILAIIYSICSNREFHRTRMFQDNSEINELLQYSGGIVDMNHYEWGLGFVARLKPASPQVA